MKALPFSLTACALAFVVGCRTTEDALRDYEANLTTGNYAAAVPEVAALAHKGDDSRLLWHLMAGAANDLNGNKAAAVAQYDQAEEAVRQNDAASVFSRAGQGTFAMMTNDRAFPYDGGGLDRIFTCLYKAVDFMTQGQVEGARTELNRAAQYQANWIYDRRRDVEAAQARMEKDAAAYTQQHPGAVQQGNLAQQTAPVMADANFMAQIQQNCNFNPATSGDLSTLAAADYVNTYVQHVTGVFRWLDGDGGATFLKAAADLVPQHPTLARDRAEAEAGAKPHNQVWIWVEDGLCPSRVEWRTELPLYFVPGAGRYLPYVGMALPVLRERTWGAADWSVQTAAGMAPLVELANVDRLVKTEYDVYMRGALAREITRVIVKACMQIALQATADQVNDHNTRVALHLSQLGVAVWNKTAVAADVRSWTALPKTVKAIRIDRPADGALNIVADGAPIQFVVPEGNTLVFIRKPGPQSAPVVKQVTFQNH